MGLKKRKEIRKLDIESMMTDINYAFLSKNVSVEGDFKYYIIGPTCFEDDEMKWVMHDDREGDDDDSITDMLPTIYGRTIEDVIRKTWRNPNCRAGLVNG